MTDNNSQKDFLVETQNLASLQNNASLRENKTGWSETTLGEVCEIIDGDRGSNYPNSGK